jgi:hypothetical protein
MWSVQQRGGWEPFCDDATLYAPALLPWSESVAVVTISKAAGGHTLTAPLSTCMCEVYIEGRAQDRNGDSSRLLSARSETRRKVSPDTVRNHARFDSEV